MIPEISIRYSGYPAYALEHHSLPRFRRNHNKQNKEIMAPPLPLEVLQHIVVLTAEDGHVPPTMAPFYAQDPYWGTSRTYLSTPGSPCRSMPLICRDLRKAGEQALLSTIRVKGSTIEKLLLFLQAREGFGRFVKCAHVSHPAANILSACLIYCGQIGSSEEPDDEEVELTSEGVQKLYVHYLLHKCTLC